MTRQTNAVDAQGENVHSAGRYRHEGRREHVGRGGVGGGIAGARSDGDGEHGAMCSQHSTQGKHTQHTVLAWA